jgi:pimeloyl-ACP methyl ester carboxylesterase
MRTFSYLWRALGASALLPALALAQAQPTNGSPFARDSVLARIRELRAIGTPEGIDTLFAVNTGPGGKQWISVRGLNRSNPVLVVMHGGPGTPLLPSAWAFQKPWEDFFTVVEWDQRGAGRNFVGLDTTNTPVTWPMADLVGDARAIVDTVRALLGKPKVFVLGNSWGTAIGSAFVAAHPDRVHAFVGVGQVGLGDAETTLYNQMLAIARARGNDTAVRELEALAPYPHRDGDTPLAKMFAVRRWSARLGGAFISATDIGMLYRSWDLSPDYRPEDHAARPAAARYSGSHVMGPGGARVGKDNPRRPPTRFAVPVFVLQGRLDLYTSWISAKQWFEAVQAPRKQFITFERSAHFPFIDEPGRFLLTLVNEVRPIAAREERPFAPMPGTPR